MRNNEPYRIKAGVLKNN